MGLSVLHSGGGCDECGTIKKSGKRSCCARGGAWFKNCGDVGGTKFDHTWVEGIQACQGFMNPIWAKSPERLMRLHMSVIDFQLNITQLRNVTQQRNLDAADNVSNDGEASYENYVELTKSAVYAYVLSIFLGLKV